MISRCVKFSVSFQIDFKDAQDLMQIAKKYEEAVNTICNEEKLKEISKSIRHNIYYEDHDNYAIYNSDKDPNFDENIEKDILEF